MSTPIIVGPPPRPVDDHRHSSGNTAQGRAVWPIRPISECGLSGGHGHATRSSAIPATASTDRKGDEDPRNHVTASLTTKGPSVSSRLRSATTSAPLPSSATASPRTCRVVTTLIGFGGRAGSYVSAARRSCDGGSTTAAGRSSDGDCRRLGCCWLRTARSHS